MSSLQTQIRAELAAVAKASRISVKPLQVSAATATTTTIITVGSGKRAEIIRHCGRSSVPSSIGSWSSGSAWRARETLTMVCRWTRNGWRPNSGRSYRIGSGWRRVDDPVRPSSSSVSVVDGWLTGNSGVPLHRNPNSGFIMYVDHANNRVKL